MVDDTTQPTIRKNLTKKQWQEFIDEWEQSGLSQPKFCKEKEISYSTFVYWRGKIKKKSESLERSPSFTKVRLPAAKAPLDKELFIERRNTNSLLANGAYIKACL